ncbi:4'-phosphopantetheinyl transferase family protein [Geodermatophilus sabuli]|uniref:4'-phosphopantetheinyl transferase n=1 Tax=Geodermatophilus sabuli TaxID=1564158 RepID=A0A285ECD1_9ACTN|nr:4'-phosphopantetheinyl transferase superfamily protein [Geodermatophilus sabuli]MBB3084856.1 4'-phosphopantetheinyl transferase [Geodermatophilus sabuli]SNX95736.1 4'-phosphopantetheinyl transferase [Geodermatophilus sabuli]
MPNLTVSDGTARSAVLGRPRRPPVDVWLVDLGPDESTLARAATALTDAELSRADRGTPAVRRRRIALRAALRCVIAAELSCTPSRVPLSLTPAGRPFVPATVPGARSLDVSCAASADLGLVVLGRGTQVGIDLEQVGPWTPDTRDEGWLTDREAGAIAVLGEPQRARVAARTWTVKEAVLKASGSGIATPPRLVDTGTGEGSERRVGRWHVVAVPVPVGFVASLATSRRVARRRRPLAPRVLGHGIWSLEKGVRS